MGRPPVNDPSNLPDNPKYSSDPAVTNRLVSEFRNRMAYLTQSYHLSKALIPTTVEFNEDLKRLERGLSRKRLASDRGTRLNAALETAITCEAMSLAVQEGSEDLTRSADSSRRSS